MKRRFIWGYGKEKYPPYDKEGCHLVVGDEKYVCEVELLIRKDERYKINGESFGNSAD